MSDLPSFTAIRYVQPLREGGSLPAIVDTHGGGMFVAKFRGAGQGAKVLVAELVVGLMAEALGLPVPRLATLDVPAPLGQGEPDPEIQDLLQNSRGINVGLRYLDGAFNFSASAAGDLITPEFAADVVWLDAFVTNPDRTHRNPNLLICNRQPWLIDHGAALYAHHNWASVDADRTRTPFPLIRDHVLLSRTGDLEAADARLSGRLTEAEIVRVLSAIPDSLLLDPSREGEFESAVAARARYLDYLLTRLQAPRAFVDEAVQARARALTEQPRRLSARR
jgi:hypothetical protein